MRKHCVRKWVHAICDLLPLFVIPLLALAVRSDNNFSPISITIGETVTQDLYTNQLFENGLPNLPLGNSWYMSEDFSDTTLSGVTQTSGSRFNMIKVSQTPDSYAFEDDHLVYDLPSSYTIKPFDIIEVRFYCLVKGTINSGYIPCTLNLVGYQIDNGDEFYKDIGFSVLRTTNPFGYSFNSNYGYVDLLIVFNDLPSDASDFSLRFFLNSEYNDYYFTHLQFFNVSQYFNRQGIDYDVWNTYLGNGFNYHAFDTGTLQSVVVSDTTVTYNDTDVGSQMVYTLYNTCDKYFNFNSVGTFQSIYNWFGTNIFNGDVPLSFFIVWNIILYEFIMDLIFLTYMVFMFVIDFTEHLIDGFFDKAYRGGK